MTELAKDVAAIDVIDLLKRYSFELDEASLDRLVDVWLDRYPIRWVRLAVIEALYQGRYKAISVEQILNLWQRRGRSLYRFNHEFERVVCGRFPSAHYISSTPQFTAPSRSYRRSSPKPLSFRPLPLPSETESEKPIASDPIAFPQVEQEPMAASEAATQPELITELPVSSDLAPEAEGSGETASTANTANTNSIPLLLPQSSPVPAFQSNGGIELEPLVVNASRSTPQRQPILQFVPFPESSDFYTKLKAVAQGVPGGEGDGE